MMMTEPTELEMTYSVYSDVYKNAYGFRPTNWDEVRTWTLAQLEQEIAELAEIASDTASLEKAQEEAAAQALVRSHNDLMVLNAISSVDAWRWLVQADQPDVTDGKYDIGYFLWNSGVGVGDIAENMEIEIRAMLATKSI